MTDEERKARRAIYDKKYREKNKARLVVYQKEYREKNKEQILANKKKYREKNKDKIVAYQKEYRQSNREALNNYNVRWNLEKTNTPQTFIDLKIEYLKLRRLIREKCKRTTQPIV